MTHTDTPTVNTSADTIAALLHDLYHSDMACALTHQAAQVIEALTAPAMATEPVAWLTRHELGPMHFCEADYQPASDEWSAPFPVFAHPQDAESLRELQELRAGRDTAMNEIGMLRRENVSLLAEVERLNAAQSKLFEEGTKWQTRAEAQLDRAEKAEAEVARLTAALEKTADDLMRADMRRITAEADLATSRAETAMAFEVAAQTVDTAGDSAVTEALGQRLCCSGHHCGCQGADVGAFLVHLIRENTPAEATAALAARDKAKDDQIAELEAKLYVLTEAAEHLLQNYLRDELDEPDLCVDEGHWSAIHDLSSALQSEGRA